MRGEFAAFDAWIASAERGVVEPDFDLRELPRSSAVDMRPSRRLRDESWAKARVMCGVAGVRDGFASRVDAAPLNSKFLPCEEAISHSANL